MVNRALRYTDARAVRPYEVGTANFDTPSYKLCKFIFLSLYRTIDTLCCGESFWFNDITRFMGLAELAGKVGAADIQEEACNAYCVDEC